MAFMDILAFTVINILMDHNDHKTVMSLSIALGKAHFKDFKKRFWYDLKAGDMILARPESLRGKYTPMYYVKHFLEATDDPNLFLVDSSTFKATNEWYRVEKITKCRVYLQLFDQTSYYHQNENVIVCNAMIDTPRHKHFTCKKTEFKTGMWSFIGTPQSTMKVPLWMDKRQDIRRFEIMKDETKLVIPVCEA